MTGYLADLHIHSLLSPCASVEMTPRNIVWHAAELGIDIIAVTDHNACDNAEAFVRAAQDTGVKVLPGMEVETKEEVHIIVLFDDLVQLGDWERFVESNRLGFLNDEKRFGAQFVVDEHDNFIKNKPEMLLAPLKCGISEVVRRAARLGGICIASHVDRPMYSIISKLGFIPPDLEMSAVEVSRMTRPREAYKQLPAIGDLPVITSSDAHTIQEFVDGARTVFYLDKPCIAEIKKALQGLDGRRVEFLY